MKILLLLLFSIISLCSGQTSPDPVHDINGNSLTSGTQYYILPVVGGEGGGVTLASTRTDLCPLDVVEASQEVDNGLPLTFTPADPNEGGGVVESTDLNIVFSAVTTCGQSNVWMIEEYGGSLVVTAHGVSGSPGPGTISNWFKIEKYDDDYKLVFCPTVCSFCKIVCGDIGVEIAEEGSRRLAISDVPLKVKFKTA